MREQFIKNQIKETDLGFHGSQNSRLNNLTDAVFGIALALLIFNVTDANSFSDLLVFAKSFPAILLSIILLYLVWKEHVAFSNLFGIQGFALQFLNLIFIALVIFYVYPLRFMTKLLTSMFFHLEIEMSIKPSEIPDLMIFYGSIALALYFTLYLAYKKAIDRYPELSPTEKFYSESQKSRMIIMALVPLLSLILSFSLKEVSIVLASSVGGSIYGLYPILIKIWKKRNTKRMQKIIEAEA